MSEVDGGIDVSARAALLALGLGVHEIKALLQAHGVDAAAPFGALPGPTRAALTGAARDHGDGAEAGAPASAAPAPRVGDAATGVAARLERVRLRLHRLALQSQPTEALPAALRPPELPPPSPLRLYLGLEAPPHEAVEELGRIDALLAAPPLVPPAELHLGAALGLAPLDLEALWLLVAAAVSPRHLWLLDAVYGARTEGALPLDFVAHALAHGDAAARLGHDAPLVRRALLVPAGDGRWRAAARAVDVLAGSGRAPAAELDAIAHELAGATPRLPAATERAFAALRATGSTRLLATGVDGAGARALALRLGADLGRRVLEVDLRALAAAELTALYALAREARLDAAVLLLRHGRTLEGEALGVSERARLLGFLAREPLPLVLDGGAGQSLGLLWGVGVGAGLHHLALDLPGREERPALWRDALLAAGTTDPDAQAELVSAVRAFPLGVDHMADALRLARVEGDGMVAAPSLRRACERLVTHRLGEFAVKVETRARWSDLVVPEDVGEAIADFVQQVELSHYVLDELGYGRRVSYGRGLAALLSGPSGTGKTMTATLIAGHLGVELYRIDLSRIVSKYIGETEQRLGEVFREAQATGAALLFDEADSLFAKRTEVKSSNDRYANLEVNFLLQQLEEHTGIALLTTNYANNLDKAFMRRIRFHVQFPEPDAAARAQLWRSMIPETAPLAPDLDLARVAEGYPLSGGAIRNAVLRAAFRAAAEEQPLGTEHLESAAQAEMTALGRLQWEPR